MHVELIRVVSVLIAFFTKFDSIDILGDDGIILVIRHSLHLSLDCGFNLLQFFIVSHAMQLIIQLKFGLLEELLLGFWYLWRGVIRSFLTLVRSSIVIIEALMVRSSPLVATAATTSTASISVASSKLLLTLKSLLFQAEELFLILRDVLEKYITVAEVNSALIGQIAIQTW